GGETTAPAAGEPAAAAPPPQPAAERRLVSVLFADLVGFTTASENRDAEETRELLSRYFDASRRLIELYGGTVEKFIGDAVMAVWGTPTATEDDAERAVRAALDLVTAVSALGDEVGAPELRARAGVLTVEAAVTIGAEGQGMVAGDLVNTASRVQSVAQPGTVYVGDSTRRATEQTIAYEDAGSHELQGKGGLYPLYRALRVVSGARGALKSQGLEAPFVGRDRELRLIKDLFHACADDGRAHLVSVTGIAGIGKSRLTWEFFKYIDGLPALTYWQRGRCLSYGEGVTYWALADLVRMRCRIAEDEDPASAVGKLQATLVEHVLDEEERRFVEPRVAHLLGLEEGARFERDDLFAAWRLFFERLADTNPTALVFEDMQWADDSLLDFIDYLLEFSRESRLFVLTLARPELQESRPTWGAGRRNFTSLYLEPLSAAAMEALLAGLVPGLPDEVHGQILERAEGVPLYAVETVRMLLDRGVLVQDGAVYRPTGPIASLEVPETLHALIAARLDGLSPEERRALQDASVLGKTFSKSALAALSGIGPDEVEPLLRSLVRKEVLAVQADPRSPEHGQYSFLQDLVRYVAYETLSKRERRAKHLAAAAHLESAFPDEEEIVEVLASHYLDAYQAAPEGEDAGEIRTKAREKLARAGDRAASLAAAREAQRYFEQAAELAEDEVTGAGLQVRAGQMAARRSRNDEARALYDRAHATLESQGLSHPAARVSARLAEIDFYDGHLAEAVTRLEEVLETLSSEDPDGDVAEVAAQLGRFLVLGGRLDEALPQLERALILAEALELSEVFVQALISKGTVLGRQNRRMEAEILLGAALERALAEDLLSSAQRAANNLAAWLEARDAFAESEIVSNRGIEIARRIGDRRMEGFIRAGTITTDVVCGRWDEALASAAEIDPAETYGVQAAVVVEIESRRGQVAEARERVGRYTAALDADVPEIRAMYALSEAIVLRAEGNAGHALETIEQGLPEALGRMGTGFIGVKLMFIEALEAAFELNDGSKVEELLGRIEALTGGERSPMLAGHALRFRAKLETDASRAEAGFRGAEALFRELGLVFPLALTQLEHAERLVAAGRSADAQPLFEEARQTFERLEATPWVERTLDVRSEGEPVAVS
ncbi:MAG TPA: adenylate/guanylate cyclase domain-containing protein, partial [Gaiellaceae bacterium]|nr:adenylate/guanylate cyclase domain-containing protein [Gaiellaceae bacterium]